MNGTHRRSVPRVLAGACALGLMLAPSMPAAFAAAPPVVKQVTVNSLRVYTDTGLNVRTGDTITIRASGFIHFGVKPIDHLTPAGIARRSGCDALTGRTESKASPRPAPGLDCWSLIGRIGAGGPFAVGKATTIRAKNDGELLLGINDNRLNDNAGTWSATVTVSTGTSATPAPAPAKRSSSSSKMLLLLGAVLLAVVLIGAAVLARFARARRAAAEAAPPVRKAAAPPRVAVPVPEPAPAGPAERPVISIPEAESHAVNETPLEGDFTDVNIFEVEFPDSASLRVGYNYFPEGTLVRFRIAQRARADSIGDFVTMGGGSQYHFVTVELNGELEPNAGGADVSFTWVIGGVPFQYSVRRVLAG